MRAFSRPAGGIPPAAVPEAGGRGWVLFAAFGTLVYMSARIALAAPEPEADPEIGGVDPFNTIFQLILLSCGLYHALRQPRATLETLLRAWPFVLAVALAGASVLWSQSPGHTLRRSVSLGTLLLFAAAVWQQLGPRRFMRVVVGATIFASGAGLAEALFRPAIGFDVGEYSNAIRGIFWQKNNFGVALLGGTMALAFLVLDRGRIRGQDAMIFLGFLVMLLLSRSTTALLLSLFVAGSTVLVLGLDRGGGWRAATVIAVASALTLAVLALALLGSSGLFEAVGKDDTLTGRVHIWAEVYDAIARRRYLGFGYNAFWLQGYGSAELIWQRVGWIAPTAHSGYLDVMLQLGFAGLLAVALINLVTLLRVVRAMLDGQRRLAFWVAMLVVVYGVYNYSESLLLRPDLQFLLWIMGALALAPVRQGRDAAGWTGPWSFHSAGRAGASGV